MLAGVTGSLDGRPLPVDRSMVMALVRYLRDEGIFLEVHPPEALEEPEPALVRIELEERYESAGARFAQRMRGEALLRVRLPGDAPPLRLEASARSSRRLFSGWRRGEARAALMGELQRSNLETLCAQLRADPRLFEVPL